ncbi:MAG: glutamate synthase large subunit [Bacteroidales bacterium]|nr:glutamate synthase large subunit [Bacteroidales bacterium]
MDLPQKNGLYNSQNEHDSCGIGFVAHIKGKKSHEILKRGLGVLSNMAHRGAESADNKTGDGAGITLQIPYEYFDSFGYDLPENNIYGTGLLFLPKIGEEAEWCKDALRKIIKSEKLRFIAYRQVPVNSSVLGEIALSTEPYIEQVFITGNYEQEELERKLYIVRKRIENELRNSGLKQKSMFHIPSLSSRVIIYKGMFTPEQLEKYYLDFKDERFKTAIALVHSRFSTNTFPTWDLAQPFRYIAHNGEFNTIKGNRLWMHARESLFKSELFEDDLQNLFPVIEPDKSDSASFDNALEFLVQTGRSIPHALSMLIPESWNAKNPIPKSLKAFYEYHSTFMEPWDGPASIMFTDGRYIGGTLDRNGLRPSRYLVTNNDLIVMGSETGVQSFKGEDIKEKGRLRPGKILLVDTKLGIIIPNEEIKAELARRNPYANWLKEHRLDMEDIKVKQRVSSDLGEKYTHYLKEFDYTKEDINLIIKSMAGTSVEPLSSMGNDTPMAVMAKRPQLLFNYFRQMFAQVTNPPIDPIREGMVMALTNYIGSVQRNLLEETPEHCHLIKFKSPLITNTDLGKIKDLKHESFRHTTLQMIFPVDEGEGGLEKALNDLCKKAEKAVDEKNNFIILSDKEVSEGMAHIPSLLAVAAVHHHLIKVKKRVQVGLIVETGEVREVHHYALLFAYGASVINPYVAFAIIRKLAKSDELGDSTYSQARERYIKAVGKGLKKIMSKMGISTLRSYHGAQIFEAIGLSKDLVDKYFTGTTSSIGGIGLEEIAQEYKIMHRKAFNHENTNGQLKHEGIYAFRKDGEYHAWNPESIALLQWATKTGDYKKYKEFAQIVDSYTQKPTFIRGMLDFKKNPIAISEVESVENIMKRFVTGAMSFGSISKEAHEAMAIAMNRIGGRSNTGEGGEDKKRLHEPSKRSAIKQVASGRFGVDAEYLVNADEIQIKVAQGAKPGEGGQLPGYKVDKIVGKIRNSLPGITLISPPPHHDIYSIEDLAQLIFDLKSVNPQAKISVKLVSESGVGTIAAGVAKAKADLITISGTEGGTGASPASSIKHAGLPMEIGLAEAHQTLVLNNLRGRVKLQTDGQIKTGRDIVIAAMLGAEEFGIATGALITLGCVMMRKCHLNTCPAGIATQNKELRKRYLGKADYIVNYFKFLAEEVREYMAEIGVRKFNELVGRADWLHVSQNIEHPKAKKLDLSALINFPEASKFNPLFNIEEQNHKLDQVLDKELIRLSNRAIQNKEKVWFSKEIGNTDRSIGAMLSGELAKKYGVQGLSKNTINGYFYGSAGQSFGAFMVNGISFKLEGDANDYLGKGMAGGRIVVIPPEKADIQAEKNIIIGNTVLYGATGGSLYVNGIAGERFAVRNSGAKAVVEGLGDHGCEYMTGGRVVVLGATGRNFAAGMSGGIAYVLDINEDFAFHCNQDMVELSKITDYEDIKELQSMIAKHHLYTKSKLAEKILINWEHYISKFVKVLPLEYKKVLNEIKLKEVANKIKKAQTEIIQY